MTDFPKIIESVFGSTLDYLDANNVAGGWLFIIPFGLYLYFGMFKKKRKWICFTGHDKFGVVIFIIGTVFTIIAQISMLVK